MNTKLITTLILLLALLIAGSSSVSASSPDVENAVTKALDYLALHQQADGGWAEPGQTLGAASPS